MPKTLPEDRAGLSAPRSCAECRIAELVSLALDQDRLTGIRSILETIVQATEAFGCILWQMEPGPAPHGPQDRLYVLAEWFQDDTSCLMHDLPKEGSLTGKAIQTGQAHVIHRSSYDPRAYHDDRFLEEHGIQGMCSLPLVFLDGTPGALNLYRRRDGPFSSSDIQHAREISKLLPRLYRTLLHRVSARLLQDIQAHFESGELSSASRIGFQKVLQGVVEMLQDELSCLEVTLFLEDKRQRPGVYARLATTWPQRSAEITTFVNSMEAGLTAWVLNHGKELRLFDIRHFERDRASIQRRYPGLEWRFDASLESQVRDRLGPERRPDDCPPLSFMCSPITAEGRTIGALHCLAQTGHGPHFYASQQQEILGLVAQQIGQRWLRWIDRRNLDDENKSWKALVTSMTGLNRFVYDELRRNALDETFIFEKALEVTQSVIEGAEITDVRLHDESTNELYFEATHGEAWERGRTDVRTPKTRRFPLEDSRSSAGAWVFHNNKVRQIDDVTTDPIYDGTFPNTRRMLIAPISVEDKVFGVLDIRSTSERPLPAHASDIAELLGKQLGMYHYLASAIRQLNDIRESQQRAIEDLAHQLRNPLSQAHERVQRLLLARDTPPDRSLRAVQGLVAKAHRVAQSTKLFVELSKNEAIHPKLEDVREEWLIPLLIEAAEDAEILLDPGRKIRIEVQRKGFQDLLGKRFQVDRRLLEQAVTNILDNASKYSYANSTVRVFGGLTKSGQLQIAVANQGVQLTSMDARAATEREWRSDLAEHTTAEGSGLGLWIVNHIMNAHDGSLQIQPTDPEGWTIVRLLFPAQGD